MYVYFLYISKWYFLLTKMKIIHFHTVGTVLKSYRKIVERGTIEAVPLTRIYTTANFLVWYSHFNKNCRAKDNIFIGTNLFSYGEEEFEDKRQTTQSTKDRQHNQQKTDNTINKRKRKKEQTTTYKKKPKTQTHKNKWHSHASVFHMWVKCKTLIW